MPVIRFRRSELLLALLGALLGAVGPFAAAEAAEISPRLAAAVQTAAQDPGQAAPLPVWVFFRDKGLQGGALAEALDRAAADLSPRTLQRRARVHGPGEPLVDGTDLPVNPGYLARAEALGADLRRQSRWLNAASFLVRPEILPDLAGLDCVARLDLVARSRRPEPPVPPVPAVPEAAQAPGKTPQWTEDYGLAATALEQINVPPAHEMGVTGRGVVVGLLDTGFHLTHESLAGLTVLGAYDFVDDDPVVDLQEGDPVGAVNHGSLILSILAAYKPGRLVGPAYGASVLLAKTEDVAVEVPAEEDYWVAGLEWAEAQGADVISSSLGYIDWYTYEDLDGNTAVTTVAADLAVGRGLVVVVSAGNARSSLGHVLTPADGDSVIAVGAVDSLGVYTVFSSPGPTADGRIKPDVMALGLDTASASPLVDDEYLRISGTSASCPLASSVAALILSRIPALTPMQVREALRETAGRAAAPDNDYGWGIVDAYAAVTYWGPVFSHQALSDTEDTAGPYPVTAVITGRMGVAAGSPAVRYRVAGGPWLSLALSPTGNPDQYAAAIPAQPLGSAVEYFLEATGQDGFSATWPVYAPEDPAGFEVTALTSVAVGAQPSAAIPDGDPAGLASVITVALAQSGTVVSLDVDVAILHPDISELTVVLTSPTGTGVTLHLLSDPGVADLAGNWPATLSVDGPGSLSWFQGETNAGDWTLRVADSLAPQAGVLESWGLNFILKDALSGGGSPPPAVTALHPNVPNPFNPLTTLRFDLGADGPTRLSIFDIRGMLVRTLVDQWLEAGPHTRIWDGRNAAGREMGSGVYLYRLEAPQVSQERKMLLLR